MPDVPLLPREFQGLIPALEAKNVNKPFVVDGRHFVVDFKGPYTGFSSLLASYSKLANPDCVETFDVEDDEFIFTRDAIYKYDLTSMTWQPLFTFTEISTQWPWSVEEVGNIWYFCNYHILIRYDPSTITFSLHSPSGMPSGPKSICKSYGRLIVLGDSRVGWSALDNGDDFTTSLATGVGSQGTSAYAPGTTYVVKEVHDGFLYYTNKAIAKGQLIELETTFRHFSVSRYHKLVNPFAIVKADEHAHIFLTKQGFFITNGEKPEAFQALFSQHLIRDIFPTLENLEQPSLKLYYAEDNDWLILSIGSRDNPSLYGMAYVLNIKRGEGGWGRFDKLHYGFGKFNLNPDDPSAKFNLGYIDGDGYAHKFVLLPYSETPDYVTSYYYYQTYSNFPAPFSGSIWNPRTLMRVTSQNEGLLRTASSGIYILGYTQIEPEPTLPPDESGYSASLGNWSHEDWLTSTNPNEDWNSSTDPDEDWNIGDLGATFPCLIGIADGFTYLTAQVAPLSIGPIGAWIEVGLFRLPVAENADEMSMITDMQIGMFNNREFGGVEDWLALPDETVDWNAESGSEDWGYGIPTLVSYSVQLIATNDGINTFSAQVPTMSTDAGAMQFYKPFLTGIFHKVRLSAENTNEAFHLKFLELSGSKAGRL